MTTGPEFIARTIRRRLHAAIYVEPGAPWENGYDDLFHSRMRDERSFSNRWARKVIPAILQKLMRHESIETTMGFYVDLDTDALAEDLYRSHEREQTRAAGTVSGAVARGEEMAESGERAATSCLDAT